MSRHRRQRTSRVLIGVMVLTVGVGAGVYYSKSKKTTPASAEAKVTQTPVPPAPPAIVTAVAAVPLPAATAEPTTQPLAATPPTTRPIVHANASDSAALAPGHTIEVPATATTALVEGKAKIDAGELVEGRKILNDALLSGSLSPDDAHLAKELMAEANKQIVFSAKRFANDPFQGTYSVRVGDMLQKIAASETLSWEFLSRINGLDPRRLRTGMTLKTLQGPFHAVVSKSAFTMDIYLGSPAREGSMYVTTLPVGLGQNDSTPTGTWMASGKLKNPAYFSPRGEGVIPADDPRNPLGEFWISLEGIEGQAVGKQSYGIHGTIDPDSVGKQASLGCIRLRDADIALVYELLVEGKSTIVVKE